MSASDNQSSEIALTLNHNRNSSSPSHAAAAAAYDEAAAAQAQESRIKQIEEYFRYDQQRDKARDVRTALLTVAVLMATVTCQVGISPPGGVWEDNNDKVKSKQEAGVSIMATNYYILFGWFMFANTLGLFPSLYMIDFLTRRFPLRLELCFAIFGMAVTYSSSLYSIIPESLPRTLI